MMGFLNPWFLGALAAIGLPIYIHLLRRHIVPPQPFSSLMFFERGTQSSTRHRRLRYLLLFCLRTALLLLLVLAFANPFIRLAAGGANSKLLLIVVDNSFSMKAGSRFTDAKQGAVQLLASRPRSQRAEVMALGGRLAVLTQPIQDAGALRSAVESIQPGDSRANLGELAHGVRALVETVRTPVELHLFSDMQKTGMPANFADMQLPANVTVVLHPAGSLTPNWTVESIHAPAQLADVKDPKKSRVQAVIAGYGTPAASRTVSLVVNGNSVATRKVDIPANGRATVEFPALDVPYGLNHCAIKIDSADGFPADDVSVFSVKRADPERVLFVHQANDLRSPLYFGAALAAASQAYFTLQSIDSEKSTDIDPSKYAFVVLSDALALPSIFDNALTRYVRGGGSVLIAAGTSAAHHARIPIFGVTTSDAHSYSRDGSALIGQTDLTHPVMNDAAGWTDLKIYYVAGVDAGGARVIVRLTDQTPLLMEKQIGEGHVLLLASGFDNLTNDLPVRPAFVAFVDRTARYLAGSDSISGSRLVDSYVPLRTAAARAGDTSVEIIGPDGRRALSLAEAASAQSFQLAHAGFYQIRFANGHTALIGVNPDARESDLLPIENDLLQMWGKGSATPAPSTAAGYVQEKYTPHSVWWYVMLLVLVAAVAESIVASRYLGTQREEA
jgi:Aerotolerance regulator N-terminal/von Willebrand factor type A domain